MKTTRERIAGLTAIEYKRKSQEDKSRQILSLETQSDICQELEQHWKLNVAHRYAETKSAKEPDQRPQFTEMMNMINKGRVEVIVCWKIDRLVRNMKEGGWLIDLLQNGKLKAIVTKEKVYLPEDNTIITAIEMAGATEYSRELSKKVIDGNYKKARKGIPNTHATIGYLNNKHKLQGERDWRDDPERWQHLRRACYKIINEDTSPYQVFKWLRDEIKLTTPKRRNLGGKLITKSTFYRFLRRTEIAGFFYHNKEKRTIVCDEMTPMISEDDFWDIQKRLGDQGTTRYTQTISTYSNHVFSPEGSVCTPDSVHRVTCDCGKTFSIKRNSECKCCGLNVSKMKSPKFYYRKYYYNTQLRREGKSAKGLPETSANEKMIELAEQITLNENLMDWSKKYINLIKDNEINEIKEKTQSRDNYFKKLEERKKRLKDGYLDGIFSQEEYREEKKKLEQEEKSEKAQPKKKDWHTLSSELVTLGHEMKLVWKDGQVKQKRDILQKLQSNFIWNEENLNVSNAKWIDTILKHLPTVQEQQIKIEQAKSLVKQGSLQDFRETFPSLCGWRESNSRPLLGRQIFYH
tara:strand:+ start:205 stop:1932 length:1728 start_codon:yes stop_codon:yes gene_type:complete